MRVRPRLRVRVHPSDEQGATMVIVVLSLIAMIGMIVLTVDVGQLLFRRRAMVNGADAAALAAAQSCAGTIDSDNPEIVADTFAIDNVSGLIAGNGGIVPAMSQGCDDGDAFGHVTVEYFYQQQLFFAGVLGVNGDATVRTRATAGWGPPGAIGPVPIVLHIGDSQTQGGCEIPPADGQETCFLWYDNGLESFGSSNFGFLDLQQFNVPASENCNQSGGSQTLIDYFDGIGTPQLPPLNWPDAPTYVCTTGGLSDSVWQHIEDFIAAAAATPDPDDGIKFFPINDPANTISRNCGSRQCIDKYDIIGFAAMSLTDLLTPAEATGGTFSCVIPAGSYADDQVVDLVQAGMNAGCPGLTTSSVPTAIRPQDVDVSGGGVQNNDWNWTDYQYIDVDSYSGGLVTFDTRPPNQSFNGLTISFDWEAQGPCGAPPGNQSARCLVIDWRSYTFGGSAPGGGADFGIRAVRLCDLEFGSCPQDSN